MFLADENFPVPSIRVLREAGHLVRSILEETPGIADVSVVSIAQAALLTILTFDKDYGELLFKHKLENPPAVVFFRDKGQDPFSPAVRLL